MQEHIEEQRLKQKGSHTPPWSLWGPYVSERSWGTVREDYSINGDAWRYFPFEDASKKTYIWGEDAIAGWCDRYQVLVFAPVFWNGNDSILKERLFGLTSCQGNHGEDVKEYYYHLDALPSHAYMKYLYKYPHKKFPYELLIEENQKRSAKDPEYELCDTGIFAESRYFDIFIEYAKVSPEDFFIKISAYNRGPDPHDLYILPHLWFRKQGQGTADISIEKNEENGICLSVDDHLLESLGNLPFSYRIGRNYLYGPPGGDVLFTYNETKKEAPGFYKDHFHEKIIHNIPGASLKRGTKASLYYFFPKIPAQGNQELILRFSKELLSYPFEFAEEVFLERKQELESFYEKIAPPQATAEEKQVQKQALSGMIWNKQIYLFDVNRWMKGEDPDHPLQVERQMIRNTHWKHLNSMRIFSMPDKWEYPWFAAWDQCFHAVIWSLIDIEFAKQQLFLLLFDQFQHPSGQIPAYEWEFSDLNPPLQGWACLAIFEREKKKTGKGDRAFLEKCFHKLLMNFSWWVNKVDVSGNNIFEGGFLGLDNITVLDRSQKDMKGFTLQQSDGTGWMAFFCLNLVKMSLELAKENSVYEVLATKFFEHYIYIAQAMTKKGESHIELWDEHDGFFYDVLRHPSQAFSRFKVRSIVGIIPLFAIEFFKEEDLKNFPNFYQDFCWFMKNRKKLVDDCLTKTSVSGNTYYVLSPLSQIQLKSILRYVWDEEEFHGKYGLRSLSKHHLLFPFEFEGKKISYEPNESTERIKGGNSNWRGPVWMPISFLLIESIKKLSFIWEEIIKVEVPGKDPVGLQFIAKQFSQELISIFTKQDPSGKRAFLGSDFPYVQDPYWNQHILFYEYFHPDTGKGMGASHQSGWTSLIANVIDSLYLDSMYVHDLK